MNASRFVIILIVFFLILSIDILWFSGVPWLHMMMHLTLLTVIALTIGERLMIGVGAAVIAGLAFTLFSAVSGPAYMVAFLSAVGVSWLFSHKIVTTRSAISFVSTVIVATMSYAIVLMAVDALLNIINHQRLHFDLAVVAEAGILQAITHPIILSSYWRLFGRHQYHHLPISSNQAF